MDKEITDESLESRRGFIKKAVYAAPAIIALGSITKPVTGAASSTTVLDPNLSGGSTDTEHANPGSAIDDENEVKSPFG